MFKLKHYILFTKMFIATAAFSQDTSLYIYFDNLSSEAIKFSDDGDYKLTTFFIYYRGYETKKKREKMKQLQKKEQEKNRRNLGHTIPETGVVYISTEPPEKLTSLDDITTISPKVYREEWVYKKKPQNIYIITPSNDGSFYKWRVGMMAYE
ncbi:hypothetical protein CHU92_11920 [Flavobacterium cyanobacteriorum]|uniref:Uncharacterized protein n=1 Tax=Flavobacterium cyanobacteriorum TaxID=2022802 RepID=A0A255YYX3_9FLAO|nr:hypothetical protein [Flavobacterium cyanobacteriorum]OYQ34371.1 hypothetical protein CHU92_11920 [Flavobacterium cyanobacteriorum]